MAERDTTLVDHLLEESGSEETRVRPVVKIISLHEGQEPLERLARVSSLFLNFENRPCVRLDMQILDDGVHGGYSAVDLDDLRSGFWLEYRGEVRRVIEFVGYTDNPKYADCKWSYDFKN